VLVFTKCGHPWQPPARIRTDLSPASVRAECEGSLRRLGVERIDLYQFHHNDPATPVEESWEAMAGLVQDGKVRWAGVSNFGVALLERCEAVRHVDSVQPEYSLLCRDAARGVIPWCKAHGTGVIVYSPLASGLLAGTRDRTALAAMSAEDRRFLSPGKVQQVTGRLAAVARRLGARQSALSVAWALATDGVSGRDLRGPAPRARAGLDRRGGHRPRPGEPGRDRLHHPGWLRPRVAARSGRPMFLCGMPAAR